MRALFCFRKGVRKVEYGLTAEDLELLVVLLALRDEESLFWSDPDELGF